MRGDNISIRCIGANLGFRATIEHFIVVYLTKVGIVSGHGSDDWRLESKRPVQIHAQLKEAVAAYVIMNFRMIRGILPNFGAFILPKNF